MKDFKIVGMAIALTCVLPCFGDGKDDEGDWKHKKTAPPRESSVNVFVDEISNELIVNFHADLGSVMVEVTNADGMVVYQEQVETGDVPTLVIPLMDTDEGMLRITDGFNNMYGEFFY